MSWALQFVIRDQMSPILPLRFIFWWATLIANNMRNIFSFISFFLTELSKDRGYIASWVTAEGHLIHLWHVYSKYTVNFRLYPWGTLLKI